jgi:hypothetical protein
MITAALEHSRKVLAMYTPPPKHLAHRGLRARPRYGPVVEFTAASVVVVVVVTLALLTWRDHLRPGLAQGTGEDAASQRATGPTVTREAATDPIAAPPAAAATAGSGPDLSFESGLAGWHPTADAHLERVSAGRSGRWAVRLSRGSGADPGIAAAQLARCRPKVGYQASIWLRASRPGLAVELQLVEYANGRRFATDATGAVLNDTTWRRVEVTHSGHRAGTALAFEASVNDLPPNASVLFDGLELESAPESHM